MQAPTKSRFRYTLLILVLLMSAIMATVLWAADVSIDSYDTDSQSITANSGNPTPSNSAVIASALGTTRDFQVTFISGSDITLAANTGVPASGNLSFSSASSTSGRGIVTYDGDNDPLTVDFNGLCSPGCADLTDGGSNTHLRVRVVENDLAATVHFRLYNGTNNDPNDYIEFALALPGSIAPGQEVDFLMPFASPTTTSGAGANPNDVGAIQMFFNRDTAIVALDVAIDFFDATDAGLDFGDLPDTYGTLLASDGARHQLTSGLRLGSDRDGEPDGQPSVDADADNLMDVNDEDGVIPVRVDDGGAGLPWNDVNGGAVQVTVAGCSGTCRLSGWIDWDNSGTFEVGERIFNNTPVNNGTAYRDFTIPTGASPSSEQLYARFRVCEAFGDCNTPIGLSQSGEVEDYRWGFGPLAVTLSNSQANPLAGNNTALPLVAVVLFTLTGLAMYRFRQQEL